MDRRFITVLGVSLLFALVVSGIFYQLSKGGGGGGSTAAAETKDLVVATKPLTVGSTLKAEDVKLIKTPASAFPKGGFSKLEEVVDRPIISNILIDEPLVEGRIAAKGAGMGLAPIIPTGMRAVSLKVSDVVGVVGFVQPGLHVDVLVTGRPPRATATMTATVLQNITVLSSGQALAPDTKGQAISYQSVTLLVTPTQAEILTLAQTEGHIQLVLRNSRDSEIKPTPGSDGYKLYGTAADRVTAERMEGPNIDLAEPVVPKPRRRAPTPKAEAKVSAPFVPRLVPEVPNEIIMIRGDKRTTETVAPARPGATRNQAPVDPPLDGTPNPKPEGTP
ncbi:MAG: Flp pilus assembly protein CpaB [Acidobacteria bacterium]|nr:Flp pilus assembly protein CpaB [Acidobacteriota bacterium]